MAKKMLFAGVMAISMALGINAFAQGNKIIFVDMIKVFDNYQKTIDYDKSLQAEKASKKKALDKKKEEIEKLKNEIKLISKASDRKSKKAELSKKLDDYNASLRNLLVDLQKERDERMKDILKDIKAVIKNYAKKNNISLVLARNAIAFGDKSMDKTSEIIKMLNSSYKRKKK